MDESSETEQNRSLFGSAVASAMPILYIRGTGPTRVVFQPSQDCGLSCGILNPSGKLLKEPFCYVLTYVLTYSQRFSGVRHLPEMKVQVS